MLTSDKSIKLIDFGNARVVSQGGEIAETLGTVQYQAPELLQQPFVLSQAADIYSYGIGK